MQQTFQLPPQTRSALFRAQSFDETNNTIDVTWTSGAPVRRSNWMDGEYDEMLMCGPQNVRLDRLNAGAAFLDTHDAYSLGSVIGSVVRGTARMAEGKGVAQVLLSRAAGCADTIQNIRDGVINNISVGYIIHAATRTERDGQVPLLTATDWEPVELSAVPVPADPSAQIRSARRGAADTFPCLVTRAEPGPQKEANMADDPKPGASAPDKPLKIQSDQPPVPEAGKAGDGIQDKKTDTKDPATPVVDPGDASPLGPAELERRINDAVKRALADERERVNTISDLAERAGLRDFGAEHVRVGTKLKSFREQLTDKLLEERKNDGGPKGTAAIGEPSLEMAEGDQRAAGEAAARRILRKPAK